MLLHPLQFEEMIRKRPGGERFGLRSLAAIESIAWESGWRLTEKRPMPKGNFVLVFKLQ